MWTFFSRDLTLCLKILIEINQNDYFPIYSKYFFTVAGGITSELFIRFFFSHLSSDQIFFSLPFISKTWNKDRLKVCVRQFLLIITYSFGVSFIPKAGRPRPFWSSLSRCSYLQPWLLTMPSLHPVTRHDGTAIMAWGR